METYHPYQYPDANLSLTLDVTTPGGSLLRYAQDEKNWNRYNTCYIYRHNQLHLLTIRDVKRGEKLINSTQRGGALAVTEDGLLYKYAYMAETQRGGDCRNLAERYKDIRGFKMEMGMESNLLPYHDWTEHLIRLRSLLTSSLLPEYIDFDMECILYFRYAMGLGLNVDSQGVCEILVTEQRAFPPFGPD